jgi:hypothetical protein
MAVHTISSLIEAMVRVVVRCVYIDVVPELLQAKCGVHHEPLGAA